MICEGCGAKNGSWQEYCSRCGGDLVKKQHHSTEPHSMWIRFFSNTDFK